ncbi:MAG TPA: hypothetical protein PLU43_08375 [Lachnospiraceae bacterium]|nr:hypothetical protein [Lachnospiraceae bacterium]
MNKQPKSKTSLFLMELIITILFFSIAGAVCMQLFVKAHTISEKTKELNHAVTAAQGFAEVMRGTDGSIESILAVYPDAIQGSDTFFEVFYDQDFQPCEPENAVYVSDITLLPNGAIQNMEIRIVKLSDYEEIYSLNATKYMNIPKG